MDYPWYDLVTGDDLEQGHLLEACPVFLPSRLRLLPPYREHLAQGFARFFMRVGLPVDIPAFR